ncbi:uncharacterized protein VTP21DRAFT_7154 [Calcarisporiella thermophila]|uniref:uncharacterized protein n=1 Tax=Calcarisporiella thermophila TaxID=911321 RepID=UPI0037431ABD
MRLQLVSAFTIHKRCLLGAIRSYNQIPSTPWKEVSQSSQTKTPQPNTDPLPHPSEDEQILQYDNVVEEHGPVFLAHNDSNTVYTHS